MTKPEYEARITELEAQLRLADVLADNVAPNFSGPMTVDTSYPGGAALVDYWKSRGDVRGDGKC